MIIFFTNGLFPLILEKQDEYSDHRLWEVQRILTALKRKQRNLVKMKSEKEKKEQEELQKLIEEEKYALIEQVKFLKFFPHDSFAYVIFL